MGWQDIRAAARDVVHSTFGVAATYYAPGSAVPIPVTVRFHTGTAVGGDLDNRGYAEQIEDVNRVIFDTQDEALVEAGIMPAYKGKVVFVGGVTVYLEASERQDGARYHVWNVVRDRR